MPRSREALADVGRLYRSVRREAHSSLEERLTTLVEERRAVGKTQREAESVARSALGRVLSADAEYKSSTKRLLKTADRSLARLSPAREPKAGVISRDVALGLVAGGGISDIASGVLAPITLTLAKDSSIQVFGPPYADSWSLAGGDGLQHDQQKVWADKSSGHFGFLYTIGKEGGTVYCAAAVWIWFMRQTPGSPPGMGSDGSAQVRTYTPFSDVWRDLSYVATAHQHAGFGVYVVSWDLKGGDFRVDQDYEPWEWSDGTGWYEDHHNPSYPSGDEGDALSFQNTAPYFPIHPGRMYAAAVWCFGEGDANGTSLLEASFAQAKIDATAKFIVVGQQ
jgi:hypothetical protein